MFLPTQRQRNAFLNIGYVLILLNQLKLISDRSYLHVYPDLKWKLARKFIS